MTTTPPPDSRSFWDRHYDGPPSPEPPTPNPTLVHAIESLYPPGTSALELACGRGGDALWLAARGWEVTATDVSQVALTGVDGHAERLGLGTRLRTQRHDLAESAPRGGPWDLVYACFFHTVGGEDREVAVRRAAGRVAPGGMLLLVDHASSAPWSWEQRDDHPRPEQTWASLDLPGPWTPVRLAQRTRLAVGPDDQQADVVDNVIAARLGTG